MINAKKSLLVICVNIISLGVFSQNNCNSAVSLGVVPSNAVCPGTPNGNNTAPIAANLNSVTPSNPYTYIPDCNGVPGNNMELFANDLWFSFTATANILEVNLTNMIGMTEANIGFYTGNCAQLVGLGCSVGTPVGGNYNALLEPLTPGQQYFIQVSGAAGETGSFNISIANNLDCNDCLTASILNVTPAPTAGTYQPGTTVNFCFTIEAYAQVSSNWLHGVDLEFGAGWDLTTLVATPPASCSGSGVWGFYNSVTGFSGTYGPGFFYDYNGFPNGPGDGNPGNNFGDLNAQNCDPQFCWSITTSTTILCNPLNPPSLNVVINTLSDGESGSWNSVACIDDPETVFNAVLACCDPPLLTPTSPSCAGFTDGQLLATVAGAGITTAGDNYNFIIYDASGVLISSGIYTVPADNADAIWTFLNLPDGDYLVVVTDDVGCVSSQAGTISPPVGAPMSVVPANLVLCVGDLFNASFATNPLQAPEWDFTWTMNTDIGAGLSGSANPNLSFTTVNNGSTILVSTVTVTPIGPLCPGVPNSFTITVNPAPIVTLLASPDPVICPGESVDLQSCYTPQPLGVSTPFVNNVDEFIDGASGQGTDSGTTSVTSSGILPGTLSAGTLESICFTLQMATPGNISYFTIDVNGTTYTSGGTAGAPIPAGATYSAALNTLWQTIDNTPPNPGNGQVPPVTATYCVPAGFINTINTTGLSANTTWALTVYGVIGNNEISTILDYTVVIEDIDPYTYSWTPTGTITSGSTSGSTYGGCLNVTVEPASTTLYQFNITDNGGCTATETINITVTTPPTANIGGSASYCQEDAGATGITIPVTLTGVPDWSITYDTDGNLLTLGDQVTVNNISTSPFDLVTNASSGTYQLVSVSDQGCSGGVVSGSFTVSENPSPILSVPAAICAGGLSNTSTTITANGTPANPTAWTIVGGTASAGGTLLNANTNTVTVSSSLAGTLILEYTNSIGCSNQVTVTVNPIPVPTATNGGAYCVGQTIALDGGPSGLTYSWSGPNAFSSSLENPTIPLATIAMAGSYTVIATNANGCSASASTTVVVNAPPVVAPVADFSVCSGITNNVNVGMTSNQDPNVTYTWIIASVGSDITGGSAGGPLSTITQTLTNSSTVSQTINYVVTATNSVTGCVSSTMTFTVTVNPPPTITGVSPICAGGLSLFSDNITGSGTPSSSPAWAITGGSGSATLTNVGSNVVTITGVTAGTVNLSYTNGNGCVATTVVTVNPIPVPTATNTGAYCAGQTIALDGGPTGLTYSWSGPNAFSSSLENPTIPLATTAMAGSYTLIAANANGCSASALTNVVVNPLPTAIISGTNTICAGSSTNLTFTLTGTGNFDVVYTDGASNFSLTGINSGATVSVSPSINTTYTLVSVIDNGTSCAGTISGTANITVTPLPVATISAAPGPICAGENAVFTITGTVGATVTYTTDGSATTPTVVLNGSGNATITVPTSNPTNPNITLELLSVQLGLCSDLLSETSTIIVNDLPTYIISATLDPSSCIIDDGSITISGLTASTSYDLTYDGPNGTEGPTPYTTNGSGEIILTLLEAGGYDNFIIDDGVCQNTLVDPQTLVPPGAPDFNISLQLNPSTCIPGNDGEILISGNLGSLVDGNNYTYSYIGPSGLVGPIPMPTTTGGGTFTIDGLVEGSYSSITVTDVTSSCVGSQAGPINLVGPVDPVVAAVTVPLSVCSNINTFSVQENGGAPNISWNWTSSTATITNSGDQNPTVTNAVNGEVFTVEVTNTLTGCTNSATTSIIVTPAPFAGADNADILCNTAGSNLDLNSLLEVGVSGGSWTETTTSGQFTPGTGLFDASGLTPQDYTFEYTVLGTAPCANDVSIFTITVTGVPNAGNNNLATLCNSGSSIDLNTLLSVDADAGGTWSETTAALSGGFTGGAGLGTGILNGNGVVSGPYTFAYDIAATASCPGDQSTFTVTISNQETAGLDDLTLTLCNSTGSSIDLNTVLNGNSVTGSWTEVSASGQFDNSTGILLGGGLAAGPYTFTYTVNSSSPCIQDISDFTVTISNQETAGFDDFTSTLCNSTGSTINLNTLLSGNSIAGSWSETSASGQFDNSTGILIGGGLAAGPYTFTYTVNSISPCIQNTADFSVTISNQETAGLDDLSSTLCNSGSTIDLNTLLNGNTVSGTWSETTTISSNQFNAGVFDGVNLGAGPYTFTYTVNSAAPCVQDVSDFTVTISNQESAGLDNLTFILCNSGSTIDLNTLLNGNTVIGTWAETTGSPSNQFAAGVFDGNGLGAGPYTFAYTVNSATPCIQDVSDFTVTISNQETAGADDLTTVFCNTAGNSIDLNTLLNGNTQSGTWAETTASGQFNPALGTFDGSGLSASQYNFTYTVLSTSPCITDVSNFSVNINENPIVTPAPIPAVLCDESFIFLSGNPSGGTGVYTSDLWTGPGSAGLTNSSIQNPVFNAANIGIGPGSYVLTYTVTDANSCTGSADITVLVNPLPTLTVLDPAAVCSPNTVDITVPAVLSTDIGSISYYTDATFTTTISNPAAVGAGTYYVVADNLGCTASGSVTVTVNDLPVISGVGSGPSVCNGNDGSIDVNLTSGPLNTGILNWTGTSSGSDAAADLTAISNISGLTAGNYDVIFTDGNGCVSNTIAIGLNNPGAPILNNSGPQTECDSYQLPVITGADLTGSQSYWTATGGTGTQLNAGDFISSTQTIYIYDINGSCSDEESFNVTINLTPVISTPTDQTACESFDLPTITGTNISATAAYYNNSQALGGTVFSGPITTTQTVWVYDENGACNHETSFVVTINPLPTVTDITGGDIYCAGDVVAPISVTVTGSADWTIDYTLDGASLQATGSTSPISLGNSAGVYVVTGVTDNSCSNAASGTETIVVNSIPVAPTSGTDTTYCSAWTLVPMTAQGTGGTYTWYDGSGVIISTGSTLTPNNTLGVTEYYVSETVSGCEGPTSVVIITINQCEITIPTAFTPDGDAVNETWEIVDLDEVYPDNVVSVFNRWGNIVYQHDSAVDGPYDSNRWDGTFKGESLPVASYYFVIDLNDEEKTSKTGTVSILKK